MNCRCAGSRVHQHPSYESIKRDMNMWGNQTAGLSDWPLYEIFFVFLSFNRDAELQELSEDGSTLRKRNQAEPDQPTTV